MIFLGEASRIVCQHPTKYGLLNHPFDGPLRPLIQTLHNPCSVYIHISLDTWSPIALWKLDFRGYTSMYGLPKLESNYPVKIEVEKGASALFGK